MFLVFEGPEGSGKSTQAALLAASLRQLGKSVVQTREPGGTQVGERLRSMLLDPNMEPVSPLAEALLYTAARAEHVERVIRPALAAGEIVICDRFVDSTIAYHGAWRGLDVEALGCVQRFATGGLEPDLRLLLDLPVDVGLARRYAEEGSVNRLDSESVAFHERVRASYLASARTNPSAWRVVNADRPKSDVAASIWTIVRERVP